MKNSTNSNMYAAAADSVWRTFGAHLSGNEMGLWCIVSEKPLGETARKALSNSAAALGFGETACTFVTLQPMKSATATSANENVGIDARSNEGPSGNANADSSRRRNACENAALEARSLFRIVEGIDPLCVVATDAAATSILSSAYRQQVPLEAHCRLLGRDAIAFELFEDMMREPASKQKAWALLKKLPRLD